MQPHVFSKFSKSKEPFIRYGYDLLVHYVILSIRLFRSIPQKRHGFREAEIWYGCTEHVVPKIYGRAWWYVASQARESLNKIIPFTLRASP